MKKNVAKKIASILLVCVITCLVACDDTESMDVSQSQLNSVSMDKLNLLSTESLTQEDEQIQTEQTQIAEEDQPLTELEDTTSPIDGIVEEENEVAMTDDVDGYVEVEENQQSAVTETIEVSAADNNEVIDDEASNWPLVVSGTDEEPLGELTFSQRPVALGASFNEKVNAFLDEANNSLYAYVSDTIFVTINHGTHKSGEYYLTHVIVSDPSQFRGAQSYGIFGGARETCSSAAARTGAILLTNGGYFSYDTGTALNCCAIINDGQIMNNVPTHGREVCLKSDGTLFTPEAGLSAQSLIDDGVIYSWSADPVLIRNYERPWYADDVYAPRTAIGMIEPCEYYIITSGTYGYEKGFYCSEMQDIFQALNCSFAANFDGGGSTTLVFRGNLINSPAYGDERAVADFLCFYN